MNDYGQPFIYTLGKAKVQTALLLIYNVAQRKSRNISRSNFLQSDPNRWMTIFQKEISYNQKIVVVFIRLNSIDKLPVVFRTNTETA